MSRLAAFLRSNPPTKVAPFDPRRLGDALSAFASSPVAAEVARSARFLDSGRTIDSYLRGGCFLFAEAFGRWAGPAVELLALKTFDDAGAYVEMDHVVARIGDHYFDAGGAYSEAEFIEHCERNFSEDHWLGPFTEEDAERDGISCEVAPLGDLLSGLRAALGDPDRWGVPREDDRPGGWWSLRVMPETRGGDVRGILRAAREAGVRGADAHSGGVTLVVRNRDRAELARRLASVTSKVAAEPEAQHAPGGDLPRAYRPRGGEDDF